MNNYIIYIGGREIATVSGTEFANEAFDKAMDLAELLNETCSLAQGETGEVIAFYNPEEEEDYEEPVDIDDECGFDPYEGCYTYDC